MKKWLAALLALTLCAPCAAFATEGAYLTGEDLRALQSAYSAFLDSFADTLVARGLLAEADREAWLLYQIGDFMQNGGYGTIAVMYTPGLLSAADPGTTATRLSLVTGAGTVTVWTLRHFDADLSTLPGLPLDAELTGPDGGALPCRFRWSASQGSLMYWDGVRGEITEVGATVVGDGRALYWWAEPAEGAEAALTLELLDINEDNALAAVTIVIRATEQTWTPEEIR